MRDAERGRESLREMDRPGGEIEKKLDSGKEGRL